MTVQYDITERPVLPLGGRTTPRSAKYKVSREAFHVAFGDLPFLLYPSEEHPYERTSAPVRKDQFDAERQVGEQSLSGWWLRSQTAFWGGMGITYYEPLLGQGSENRFIDSRGVNVFDHDELRLLQAQDVVASGGGDLEFVGSGESSALYRSAATFRRVSANGSTTTVNPGGTNPRGIARIPGHAWLIGHNQGIRRMNSSGTASDAVTGATKYTRPFWAKDRIFAVQGRSVFEIPYSSSGTAIDESPSGTQHLITHPSTSWEWTHISETGRAVWMAGNAGFSSSIYVTTVDTSGDAGPVLTAPTPAIELPAGEWVTAMVAYLDFLLIGTNLGFRVAVTSGDQAQLGPLLWRDEPVYSVNARGDYAWVGLGNGLTRRVALGVATSNQDLDFAYANDAEVPNGGNVTGIAFIDNALCLAANDVGATVQSSDLVETGWLRTGFARYGTLEPKYIEAVSLTGDVSQGSVGIAAAVEEDAYSPVTTIAEWNGSQEVSLNLPGDGTALKVSLELTLTRGTRTRGPRIEGYQLKAWPAPAGRQELLSIPISLFDREGIANGPQMGGDGFAYARFQDLRALWHSGVPILFQDFRTGEALSVVIEQISFIGLTPPQGEFKNWGGYAAVTIRTVA